MPEVGPDGRLAEDFRIQAPEVSLPKGGGAISGVGEKVTANPVTGSASLSIPLPITPGRGGWAPGLSLVYDSGAGNGPFGLGWRLTVPSVRRKTDKGLPQYRDSGEEADTYVLSDAEDLVPLLEETSSGSGVWQEVSRSATVDSVDYTVKRYRPRVGTDTVLIERWMRDSDRRIHWRTITPDNTHRIYGRSDEACLIDPDNSRRIFEWLLEEERDERGNVIAWVYKAEDQDSITSMPAEANRSGQVAYAYLKRVSWGNTVMDDNPEDTGSSGAWRFHLLFDYGEHSSTDPQLTDTGTWDARLDPFSRFRARFDQRCYRLCTRVLMLHSFADYRDDGSSNAVPAVVRSVELSYTERATATTLDSATVTGWRWNGTSYDTASLPPVELTYSTPVVSDTLKLATGLEELPFGLDTRQWRFVDLDGEGLNGLLTESGRGWYYKRNEGEGQFGVARRLGSRPTLPMSSPGTRLVDIDGDGHLDVVVMRPGLAGFFARDADHDTFQSFRSFRQVPNARIDDPSARFIDLNGDGHADLLISGDQVFTWYPSEARDGYGAPRRVRLGHDENQGPRLVLSREGEHIFLADMTGDGLTDLVRILRGNICYWPNTGYGTFGAKVQMSGAPHFDNPDLFDASRIRLADVDGSGPTDLLYLGRDGVYVWFNQAGNSFSDATVIERFPCTSRPADVQVADLLGNGTACLVWSSPLLKDGQAPLRYLELMSEGKPWLLTKVENNLGRETRLTYTPSTAYYLADRRAGTPWATRLPFPVHCLSQVERLDHVTGWRFTNTYAFHHGYFDGEEREFRGFGMVEQWDTESVCDFETGGSQSLVETLPPIRTRTWFHTGAWKREQTLSAAYATEYSSFDPPVYDASETLLHHGAHHLAEPTTPSGLTPTELRQAHRALKGQVLRTEVYAEDATGELDILYTTAETTYEVVCVQPATGEHPGAFRVDTTESISYAYDADLDTASPDPRVTHQLILAIDDYGVPTRTAAISYPRRGSGHDTEQTTLTVVVSESEVIHQDDEVATYDRWHMGLPSRSKTWELTGTTAYTDHTTPATVTSLNTAWSSATAIDFEDSPTTGIEKRLIGHQITLYYNDGLDGSLTVGSLGSRALVYERYALAITSGLLSDVFGTDVTNTELSAAEYRAGATTTDATTNDDAWIPSGRLTYDTSTPPSPAFCQPTSHINPWGNTTTLTWDDDDLVLTEVEDAVGNTVTATIDYGLMAPSTVEDPNGTESEATFDALGRVTQTAIRNGTEGDGSSGHSAEFTYETDRWMDYGLPVRVHVKLLKEYGSSSWQESYAYSDGGGNVVQTKVQAAPGLAPERDSSEELVFDGSGELQWASADPRWVGTGRTVVNNKGLVVKQYEPFFSSTYEYEDEDEVVEWGKSAVMSYDPVGRNTLVTLPDGHTRSWEYSPWGVEANDENDNDSGGDHEDTPSVTHLDSLGRVYKVVETDVLTDDDYDSSTAPVLKDLTTTLTLDVQGNVTAVTDPRDKVIQVQTHDVLGRPLFTGAADEGYDPSSPSTDKGQTRALPAVDGQPVKVWRSGDLELESAYDDLRRPTELWVTEGTASARLVQYTVYGDAITGISSTDYAKGRPYHIYDTAGRVTLTYDFRGRTIEQTREVIEDITADPDWNGAESQTSLTSLESWVTTSGVLDSEVFTVETSYDALDRVTEQTAPNDSVTTPGYDAGGRLTSVAVLLPDESTARDFVTEITYNARGQRESITYGNTTSTSYTYDEDRFWLTQLRTTRENTPNDDVLQNLTYTHDAAGNILSIADGADQGDFFSNYYVGATRTFTYDSLYRLIQATGREKSTATFTTPKYVDYSGSLGSLPQTGLVLANYTRSYTYDEAGNITRLSHSGASTWSRSFTISSSNNQLTGTTVTTPTTHSYSYAYNDRGAMTYLPHLDTSSSTNLTRDFRDMIRQASLPSSAESWYAYDASGQRVRKVWDKGTTVEERIYVGGYEVWRQKDGSGNVDEERQTLHVMDDQRRIAMVETLTVTQGLGSTAPRLRYQLDDHLGTALLEVDHEGGVITYEEYHPYGSTAWWAAKSGTDVSQKRYRYTGKEKDEETGLYYHGARYYAPWLGRWCSADPIGLGDGGNRFAYVHGGPIRSRDSRGTDDEDAVNATPVLPLPDGTKATRREEALRRGKVRVQEAKEENERRRLLVPETQDALEKAGIAEPGDRSAQQQYFETRDQTPQALMRLEKLGLNTDFFLVGVGVGEQAPERINTEVTESDGLLRLGGTDPHTGDIHLYAGHDLMTAIHESIHAYVQVVSMPRSLKRTLRRDVVKGIAEQKEISFREARAEFDALSKAEQADILEEVVTYSVADRISYMNDFAGADGDSEKKAKAATGYAAPVEVRSGDFSVMVSLSPRSVAGINRYLKIDMPLGLGVDSDG